MVQSPLPRGTIVNSYTIERVLGSGGFGITYLARDRLELPFAIKEYFPRDFATREGLNVVAGSEEYISHFEEWRKRFLREGQALARLRDKSDGIVPVRTFFDAFGTCYLVMDYIQGTSLAKLLDEGFTGFDAARVHSLLFQLLSIINVVHKAGLLHRDISPANIIMRDDQHVMLIDFGSSRETVGSHTAPYTRVYALGVAPLEQMMGQPQGYFSDIFAIGAVCYLAIGGKMVDALTRHHAMAAGLPDPLSAAARIGAGRYPKPLLDIIDSALAINPEQRPSNVESMLAALAPIRRGGDPLPGDTGGIWRVSARHAFAGVAALALVGVVSVAAWKVYIPAFGTDPDATRHTMDQQEVLRRQSPPVEGAPQAPEQKAARQMPQQEAAPRAADQEPARPATQQQQAVARPAAELEAARRATEQQSKEADERALQAALIVLGYYNGSSNGDRNREADLRTAIKQWQAFEAVEQTGNVTNEQRERILREAERESSLLKVATKSPRGTAADSVKGAQQRFLRGTAFESGEGQPKDVAEAAYWYALAATSGWPAAYTNLGRLWFRGTGVATPDRDAAHLLWLTAAALKDGTAMYNLGLFTESGYGGAPDPVQAKHWYQRGAERGHTDSAAAVQRLGG